MRILQYLPGLPPVMGGGMIKYALDLIWGEEMLGHDVITLVPGYYTHFHKDEVRIVKKPWKGGACYRIINPLPVSGGKGVQDVSKLLIRKGEKEYAMFLMEVKPDIIHVHSFMGLHISFLEAARKARIPVIYTTHDYYGICPKATLLRYSKQCVVEDGSLCLYCIQEKMTNRKLIRQQSNLYKFLKGNPIINFLEYSPKMLPSKIFIRELRQKLKRKKSKTCHILQNTQQELLYKQLRSYYMEMFGLVTRFHYNSCQSKDIFMKYLGGISGDVIPISDKNVSDRRKIKPFGKVLRLGFIGRGEQKGFELLKDVLSSIYAEGMQDIECHIYFNPKEKLPSYMISHEPYREDAMDRVYNEIDLLVLPSIWKETYGLVVLEALSYGVPVIVSQNVGARELLMKHNGIGIVVEANADSLKETLVKIYHNRQMLTQMNFEICNSLLELDFEKHVCNIVDMYRMCGSGDKVHI